MSNRGEVRSLKWDFGRWADPLAMSTNSWGYPQIHIDGKPVCVHTLVLEAFEGPCPPGQQCRHLNDVKTDNRWPENLCWGTQPENGRDAVRNGRNYKAAKTRCGVCGLPFDEANTYNRPDGSLQCRACTRRRCNEYYARRRARQHAAG